METKNFTNLTISETRLDIYQVGDKNIYMVIKEDYNSSEGNILFCSTCLDSANTFYDGLLAGIKLEKASS